jgi:iron complex transport system substrate-binding protein
MTRREILLLLAAAAGCSRRDATGRPNDARRVISTAPSTTEALFAVGAGDRVVGRSTFCDWPPAAQKLPTVSAFATADVEAVLALAPDLVVGVPSPASERLTEQLAPRGVATWFPKVDSFASLHAMIEGVGGRTGHADDGRRVAAEIDRELLDVERSVASEAPPRALFVVGLSPVVAVGPGSFLDELLTRAAALNVVHDGGPWPKLGLEQIADLDPDVVIDASSAMGTPTRITADAPGWSEVRGVRQGRVIAMSDPRVLRSGPRVAQGLALLARALHPGAAVASDY